MIALRGNGVRTVAGIALLVGLVVRLLLAVDTAHFCPLIDDSYYSLSIARNIADGHGITYAGEQTNGFQPLSVFLSVPFYILTGSHDALAVPLILVFFALFSAATALLFWRLLGLMGAPAGGVFMLVFWALSPYVIRHGMNGLETGLTTFFMALSGVVYLGRVRSAEEPRQRDVILLGALLGLGVLSRIDMGFWAAAVALDYVIMARGGSWVRRAVSMAITAVSAAIVCSPWFLYNQVAFGSVLPTSGSGVRFISQAFGFHYWGRTGEYFPIGEVPLPYYIGSLTTAVRDVVAAVATPLMILSSGGFLVVLLFGLWLSRARIRALLAGNSYLLIYPALILPAYCLYIFGQWFYPRYFYGTVALLMVVVAVLVQQAWESVEGLRRHGALCLAVLAVCVGGLSWNSELRALATGNVQDEPGVEHFIPLRMIEGVVPEGETVGGFQSGALAYYAEAWDVVNLDGVVNAGALHAMEAGRMAAYARERGVDWMLDLDWIIEALYVRRAGTDAPLAEWALVKQSGGMKLYRRKQATASQAAPASPAPEGS